MTLPISSPLRQALLDLIPYWTEARYFVILLDAELLSDTEKAQITKVITLANNLADEEAQFQKLGSLRELLQGIAKQEALERTAKQIDPLYFPA